MNITTRVLRAGLLAGLFVCAATASASAGQIDWPGPRGDGVVVDHSPSLSGGLFSDLSYTLFPSPTELSQEVASDFTLSAPATIRRVVWWGFYDEDNPPASEEMQV